MTDNCPVLCCLVCNYFDRTFRAYEARVADSRRSLDSMTSFLQSTQVRAKETLSSLFLSVLITEGFAAPSAIGYKSMLDELNNQTFKPSLAGNWQWQ